MAEQGATEREQVEAYVGAVARRIPRPYPERERIVADLRAHLEERLEAGESVRAALDRMGAPEEVARAYLAEVQASPASLGQRVAAFLVDVAVGMLALAPLWLAFWVLVGGATLGGWEWTWFYIPWLLALAGLALIPLSVLYFPVLEALLGQTVGKRLVGICVTRETGEQVGWGGAIVRRLPFLFEFFWLDAIVALFTRRRQRAFDLVAKTVVVRCGERGVAAPPAHG